MTYYILESNQLKNIDLMILICYISVAFLERRRRKLSNFQKKIKICKKVLT